MAECGEVRMNLTALQRVDGSIISIVDNASQVALYKFNPKPNEWEKTEVEGTLFVYMRSHNPQHGFIVMNRLNTTNLIEPITHELEFQNQNPFLLYRNGKGHIYGIWFYEKEGCARISKLLTGLSQLAVTKRDKSVSGRQRCASESEHHKHPKQGSLQSKEIDIMSLLTRAQDEYDKRSASNHAVHPQTSRNKASDRRSRDIVKPTPVRANGVVSKNAGVPLTVDTLFAHAGDGKWQLYKDTEVINPRDIPLRTRSLSTVSPRELAKNCSTENAEAILQRLLSNPAHTVEHIEKNQKEGTERIQRARSATCSAGSGVSTTTHRLASIEIMEQDLKEKLNIVPKSCNEVQDSIELQFASPNVHASQALTDPARSQNSGDIPILTPAMLESTATFSSSLGCPGGSAIDHSKNSFSDTFAAATSVPLPGIPSRSCPVPLLSPMAFTVPAGNGKNDASPHLTESASPVSGIVLPNEGPKCFGNDKNVQDLLLPQHLIEVADNSQESTMNPVGITPLNKNQLREALTYMLQNDEEFVTKIHDCYIKSLRSHLNCFKL